jgi:hypothetical protein
MAHGCGPHDEDDRMPIIELRQYTMVPGRRNDFVEIFDREFVETQEALGIEVIGQFVDLDRADRYVWMRRFPDMESRKLSLEAFYSGPAWETHKDAANATMTEWHDVLLLKPAREGRDILVDPAARAAFADAAAEQGPLTVVIWDVAPDARDDLAERVGRAVPGARALLVTDPSPNTYQRLPVREDASVVVAVLDGASAGTTLDGIAPTQVLRLQPTPRSALRG